jgi:hypothetical protein
VQALGGFPGDRRQGHLASRGELRAARRQSPARGLRLHVPRTVLHVLCSVEDSPRAYATAILMQTMLFRILAVLSPLAAIVLALPVALSPFAGDARGVFGPYSLLGLPVWAALLAAPGYLVALFADSRRSSQSELRWWWVVASLAVAALCSLIGVVASSGMFLFLPPSLLSLVSTAVLLYRAIRTPGGLGAGG